MKKTISICLTLIIIFSTIVYVGAKDSPLIKVSSATAAPGETVQLTVSLEDNPGINTFALGFDYDKTRLTLNSVTLGSGVPGQLEYAKKAVWLNSTDINYNGVYLNLTFTVLEAAKDGDANVTVTYNAGDICNRNEDDVNFEIVAGKVTVAEKPVVEEYDGSYGLTSVKTLAGRTVKMYLSIDGNPGIISLRGSISYDESVLQLVSVTDLKLLNGYTTPSPNIASPYTLRWADSYASVNNTENGRIAELTFKVNENAPVDEYSVTVNHVESRNCTGAEIGFNPATGTVTVIDIIKGDVDNNGKVNDWDAILLNRYLAGWDVTVVELACDIDENGKISDWDAILLERYLAGWDVEELKQGDIA